jgi:hypothetical protein
MRPVLILLLGTLLSACSGSGGDGDPGAPPGSGASSIRAADLCVNNGCGEAVQLLAIPDAENLLFAPDGRLFVTGGQNIYEITKNPDGSFAATPLAEESPCGFTGMAIRDGILYANGCGTRLFAGRLTAQPVLRAIYTYDTPSCIPNGLALGPDGKLYSVDEPLLPQCLPPAPKIVRLTLDPTDPMQVANEEPWVEGSPAGLLFLGLDTTLRFPNGIVRDGNIFYATDGGSVFSVELLPDGSAGPVTPLFFEPTAHDDLGLGGVDGLLVSDFFQGRILLLSRAGELLQETAPFTFTAVSSVRLGQPPMFQPTDILVTDKGVIGDNNLPIDYLTLFRRRAGNTP